MADTTGVSSSGSEGVYFDNLKAAPQIKAALWSVWILFLLAGLVGMGQRMFYGHLPAGYGSYVPWGLWIALYFHGVGMAGGVFALAALGHLLDLPGFQHRSFIRLAIILSFAAMLPALLGVFLDMGHMELAYRVLTSPNFTSMMAFNAWMYNAFIVIAAVCWYLSYKEKTEWLKPFLVAGVFFCAIIPSQSGAFFGVVGAKESWNSAILPILFLVSAITSGAALLLLVKTLIGPSKKSADGMKDEYGYHQVLKNLRIVVIGGMAAYFILEWAEFSISYWNPGGHSGSLDLILFGPYWWVFWIVHLILGGVLPLLLLISKREGLWAIGASLVAVMFVSVRLNVLIPGQAVSELSGLQEAFQHPRLTYIYNATAMEYFIGLFMVALGMAIFYVGRRVNLAATKWFQ
ncbi:MAG: polysulfide reductase NrfD [Nitrospinae bacterium]|nr:polysulfide reductase NrfD [Nitrospinota bacterium]MBF0634377.1 polysulfide reductase NrfD [Nitrospinota bacterium]